MLYICSQVEKQEAVNFNITGFPSYISVATKVFGTTFCFSVGTWMEWDSLSTLEDPYKVNMQNITD